MAAVEDIGERRTRQRGLAGVIGTASPSPWARWRCCSFCWRSRGRGL